ncbi:peptide alpha-N-acetyltransferase [Aureococcus anophagefferens]|nr:peptide alpha-N-acetyltransferase [Aureococcus anophagefferens]
MTVLRALRRTFDDGGDGGGGDSAGSRRSRRRRRWRAVSAIDRAEKLCRSMHRMSSLTDDYREELSTAERFTERIETIHSSRVRRLERRRVFGTILSPVETIRGLKRCGKFLQAVLEHDPDLGVARRPDEPPIRPMASPELAPLAVEFGDIHAQNIGLLRKLNESTFPVRYADKFYGEIPTLQTDFAQFAYFGGFAIGAICGRLEPADGDASGKRLYIMTIGVLHAYRRRGVGRKLLDYLMDNAAKRDDVRVVYLHVVNAPAGATVGASRALDIANKRP